MTILTPELAVILDGLSDMAERLSLAAHLPGPDAEATARLGAGLAALVGAVYESDAAGSLRPVRELSAVVTAWVEARPDPRFPGVTIGQSEAAGRN